MIKAAIFAAVLGAAAVSGDTCRNVFRDSINPPTLINANLNAAAVGSGKIVETGIVGNDLAIAVNVDHSIYSSYMNTAPLTVEIFDATLGSGNADLHLNSEADGFADTNRYANPAVVFVDQASDADISACTFQRDLETPWAGDLNIYRTEPTPAISGAPTATECARGGVAEVELRARMPLISVESGPIGALKACGFTEQADQTISDVNSFNRNDNSADANFPDVEPESNTVPAASSERRYTQFLGKFKVRTTRYGGMLRSNEVVRIEDSPFQITILYPQNVNVSSLTLDVIGAVVEEAAVTHQIWDSQYFIRGSPDNAAISGATTYGVVDINVLMGTTFPHAVTTFPDDVGFIPTLTLLAASTPACGAYENGGPGKFVAYDATGGSQWATNCASGQSETAYQAGILCDSQSSGEFSGVCDLFDFFYAPDLDDVANTAGTSVDADINVPSAHADFGGFSAADFGTYAFPSTRCSDRDSGNADDDACLQNIHLRLYPRAGWCDLNVALNLTLGVVCRDDANGDDTSAVASSTDSFIQAGVNAAGTDSLTDTAFDSSAPSCTSSTLADRLVAIEFALASDNFCPRIIATGDTDASMSLFESENGHATWGAKTGADSEDDAWAASDSETCTGASGADPLAAVPSGNGDLCRQIPWLYPEDGTAAAAHQRKSQGQFVFGTQVYGEVNVRADAGVNINDARLTSLWITAGYADRDAFEAAIDSEGGSSGANIEEDTTWAKQLYKLGTESSTNSGFYANDAAQLTSYKDGTTKDDVWKHVEVSQDITKNSMIRVFDNAGFTETPSNENKYFPAGASGDDAFSAASNAIAYFNGNPTISDGTGLGHPSARLGENFEGTVRFRVLMDRFTVWISDAAEEAPESVTFYADLAITYQAPASQTPLAARQVVAESNVPSSQVNRARLMGAPAITGGTASGNAGIAAPNSAGSASSSSSVASAMIVAAGVVGAVALVAGVGFFAARKRRQAARPVKMSSSTTEMGDVQTVQV